MQLHYQIHDQTQGEGKPLILLHGLFGSGDNWGVVAKHFSQHYQVITVDLRNHGKSPHSASHTYADMADDLLALCDTLGLERIYLLGHSMGGKVAIEFATQHPQQVEKLVVVDMALRAYADAHTHLIDAMLAIDLSNMQTRAEVDKALSQRVPNTMVRQFLLMNLIKQTDQLAWRINLPALKANYPHLQSALQLTQPFLAPTLFIKGERSDYVQESDIAEFHQHFKQAKMVSLPTEHWVHAEHPQKFIEVVEDFFKS